MRLLWTQPAIEDLRRLRRFLDDRDADAAAEAVARTVESADRLLDFPFVGAPLERDVRKLSVVRSQHAILHRVIGRQIEILRVHHARENWLRV